LLILRTAKIIIMAKRLFLIRHGKANDGMRGSSDFTRTLKESGAAEANMMAERLLSQKLVPQHVVSSPAARALSTAQQFASVWGIPAAGIQTELWIYEADVQSLLAVLNKLDNTFQSVALVGHNPGITEFANYLTDEGIPDMPTAGVVVINFPFSDWRQLSQETGDVLLFDYPKSTTEGL
jgi:phosphohistidine phosphatase